MATSFLLSCINGILDGKFSEDEMKELKTLTQSEDPPFFEDYSENKFGIILSETDIKTLMEKTPEKIKGYKDGLDLPSDYIEHVFCTEDFEDDSGVYMMMKSFSYNLTQYFKYDDLEFDNVCCKQEYVIITGDEDPMKLLRVYNEIKQIVPDVELGVLEKECSCT